MILFLVSALLSFPVYAEGTGYEVDTDEEAASLEPEAESEDSASEEVEPAAPVIAKPKRKMPSRASGTRAQNRFAIDEIRSAPKSVYKKNGSALDVDTD